MTSLSIPKRAVHEAMWNFPFFSHRFMISACLYSLSIHFLMLISSVRSAAGISPSGADTGTTQNQGQAWQAKRGRLAAADLGHGHSRLAHPPPAPPVEEWAQAMVSCGYLQPQGAAVSMDVDQWHHLPLRAKPHLQPDRGKQCSLLTWPTIRNYGQGASPESSTHFSLLLFHPPGHHPHQLPDAPRRWVLSPSSAPSIQLSQLPHPKLQASALICHLFHLPNVLSTDPQSSISLLLDFCLCCPRCLPCLCLTPTYPSYRIGL